MRINAAAVVLLALAGFCFVLSGFCLFQEIAEINRKLPDDQQISYWGMYSEKYSRVKTEFKRLYPHSRLHTRGVALELAGLLFLFMAAVASGFLGRAIRNAGW
jgi:hypothetical protein